ncbi:hypothetical protein [Xanthomonas maliensis]|uniref:hypothetical protein n=1 Tax=Xanthomonas maliensis TaxID=1321368 RepID=UPI0003B4320B|nr:hypothetical protein [Xanthomonas maliensis]KAB7762313.1 hypothetical protein CKY51_21690 [Xanthomonas maliensis]
MTLVTLSRGILLACLSCAAPLAAAETGHGVDNSTLHIGLRLLSGCELRTAPARADCARGIPTAVSAPTSAAEPAATSAHDASALAGPTPAGAAAARFTTVAF